MLSVALHSSTLAWKIPWTEEPGRLQSMGSLRVGHDWATSVSRFIFMHWRRKRQPTPLSCLENPRDGEPGELPSMGSHRVGHNWSDLAAVVSLLLGSAFNLRYFIIFNIINQFSQYCLPTFPFDLWFSRLPSSLKMGCGNSICFTILIKYIILKTTSDRMYLSKLLKYWVHMVFPVGVCVYRYVCWYICIYVWW